MSDGVARRPPGVQRAERAERDERDEYAHRRENRREMYGMGSIINYLPHGLSNPISSIGAGWPSCTPTAILAAIVAL